MNGLLAGRHSLVTGAANGIGLAVADRFRAEGATVDAAATLTELMELGPEHTSSLHRDLEAGAPHELDAIAGAVLRAGARHGVPTPTAEELVGLIRERYPAA